MKEKTNEPKPLAVLTHEKGVVDEIYVLDEGDSMAWNMSTNYDHHMEGASLVLRRLSGMEEKHEYYVNDPRIWHWMESLMRLGIKYIKEHPDENVFVLQEEIKQEYEKRKPYVSMHKKKGGRNA